MSNPTQKFTNARLMAVQAVYAKELSADSWEKIMSRFLMGEIGGQVIKDGIAGREEFIPLEQADAQLFTNLVHAVQENNEHLSQTIRENISKNIDYDRLEFLAKCILKVGLAEFMVNPTLDIPIIINEYTDMARSFFDGSETAIINAMLDKYGKIIRE